MSDNQLFADFSPVDAKSWKQKIQVDLKGADYNETLVWDSPDGIKVKPFYTADDVEHDPNKSQAEPSDWSIGQLIRVEDANEANQSCREALENGVECLILRIASSNISSKQLLEGLDPDTLKLYLDLREIEGEGLVNWAANLPENIRNLQLIWDPINQLAATGNWYANKDTDLGLFKELRANTELFSVDISLYQNAGANRIQQLAYALSHAREYLKLNSTDQVPSMIFLVSVDTNYFFEIAKLKALRLLWDKLMEEEGKNIPCKILAFPTKRNKTLYDYNVNMLRTTTECMAAILGGADTVYNMPYDAIYHKENSFAERISRNQLLILKNESYFDKVSNAASGAYYIESVSSEMTNKAWELHVQIQKGGGWLKQLKEHKIQKKIKESAAKQQQAFDQGQEVLVGSNKYPNEAEQMKDQLQKDPFLKKEKKKTLIEPILERRLSETLEQNRLDHE